jgi:hypothetical protein
VFFVVLAATMQLATAGEAFESRRAQAYASVSRLVLVYEPKDLVWPERFEKTLDAELEKVVPSCRDWPNVAEVRILFLLDPSVRHRADYQIIGERTEALRTYFLRRHGVASTATWIEWDSRQWSLGGEHEAVAVELQCWL